MPEMMADETKQAGMSQAAEEAAAGEAAGGVAPQEADLETRIVAPPPRQRTLTRTAEMDADCEDIDLDADVDDAADSITLELALSPHSSTTPTPSPTTADEDFAQLDNSKPFKIKDITRNIRKAVVATTLSELRVKVSVKFERAQPAIHLDCDGTEVDDEEYFSTLEPNAELIAVFPGEQWRDPSDYNANLRRTSLDAQKLRKLVSKLQPNYMNDDDLDKLSNMDPNSLVDITGREPKDNEYSARSDAARRSTELSC
ncbi:cell death activator CIDE-3 [Drosophila eugracilis]|uniref:cell death activator CIDE-3 n=1 Tax=Drosophila eugracilis TaxID=29029 RepID=UPI0007E75DE5|nr:cell death activator CIDE-3 [Drosophila eugracilis]